MTAVVAALVAGELDPPEFEATTETEIEAAFASALSKRAAALLVSADPFFTIRRAELVALAARHALPTVYPWREYVEAGGLLSYGVEQTDNFRRAATCADRILKGANSAELPAQGPVKLTRTINLKTAKALGLDVPPPLLAIADEVFE